MKDQRKPFMALDADIDDSRLERLAEEKGVATMVRPANGAGEGEKTRPIVAPVDPEAAPTPRSQMKNFSIEIPEYVWRELKLRSLERGTIKHIIMSALRRDGVTIRDADMIEDGRRDRGGND